jgi:pimeloyl-ACP methyl ester carboxylesterase
VLDLMSSWRSHLPADLRLREVVGLGMNAEEMAEHFEISVRTVYRDIAALGEAGFRVIRYDLYGRGFSDRPNVKYDAELYDRQLTQLLDGLRITTPVDLAGASMGGPIAAAYTCSHPARVRTLSLFDPGYSHGQIMPAKLRLPVWGEYTMAVEIAPREARNDVRAEERARFVAIRCAPANAPDRSGKS